MQKVRFWRGAKMIIGIPREIAYESPKGLNGLKKVRRPFKFGDREFQLERKREKNQIPINC